MSHPDPRRVADLLLDAEQRARDLLHEAAERDGLAMANTWGEVVETAVELWKRLPPETAPRARAGSNTQAGCDGPTAAVGQVVARPPAGGLG